LTHPCLVPPDLVHAVVVAARVRHGDIVELWVEEDRARRVLSAGGCAVDADTRDVVPRVLLVDRLVPEDAIGKAGVGNVFPRVIVERLRAIARTHAIDLHEDETDLRERYEALTAAPRLRNKRAVWPRVDLLDDRVLLFRVEGDRPYDDAPDVG